MKIWIRTTNGWEFVDAMLTQQGFLIPKHI